METMPIHSPVVVAVENPTAELERLGDAIAELSAHLDAATARLLDLAAIPRAGWETLARGAAACRRARGARRSAQGAVRRGGSSPRRADGVRHRAGGAPGCRMGDRRPAPDGCNTGHRGLVVASLPITVPRRPEDGR